MITKILQINLPDWIKAIIMAVTVPVAGYVLTVIQSGSFAVNWHQIAILAAAGFLGYIMKQMGTSQTIATTQPPTSPPTPLVVTERTFGLTTSKQSVDTTVPLVPPVG